MQPFDQRHYVPILFTKAGELRALKRLEQSQKDAMTPILVLSPLNWDFENDQFEKTVDEHLDKLPDKLVNNWGTRPAFVDAAQLMSESMSDGSHPIEWIVDQAGRKGLPLVPVVSPSYSEEYRRSIARMTSANHDVEVCLRVNSNDWPTDAQDDSLKQFVSELGTSLEQVHLVLDLEAQVSAPASLALARTLQSLPDATRWRTLTVAGTAIPASATNSGQGVEVHDRREWTDYQRMVSAKSYGQRQPTFGDYAISHPDLFGGVDPRVLQIRAKLKYTADDQWIIAKGGMFKGTSGQPSLGGKAIESAAQRLVARPEYTPGHCSAETWIDDAAAGKETGNPTTWVTIGTQHHLLRVLDQV